LTEFVTGAGLSAGARRNGDAQAQRSAQSSTIAAMRRLVAGLFDAIVFSERGMIKPQQSACPVDTRFNRFPL
jgi:hypothetical protein